MILYWFMEDVPVRNCSTHVSNILISGQVESGC